MGFRDAIKYCGKVNCNLFCYFRNHFFKKYAGSGQLIYYKREYCGNNKPIYQSANLPLLIQGASFPQSGDATHEVYKSE